MGSLRPLAQLLAPDFTLLTYNRRGRGGSTDRHPYAVEREVEDIAALLTQPGSTAYLYGNSSRGLLALRAAASGMSILKLAVFEPPLGGPAGDPEVAAELAALVADDQRWEATSRFLQVIGAPPDMVAQLDASSRNALAAVAPTLVYDCGICARTTADLAASVTAPTLVLDSQGSSGEQAGWTASITSAYPMAPIAASPASGTVSPTGPSLRRSRSSS